MAGFDWRAQVAATPWDWVEFYAVAPAVLATAKRKQARRPWASTRRRPFACSPELRREIADAYIEGDESVRAIAARYGISPPTVLNYAKGVER